MKIYIAGHNQEVAKEISELLKENGHEITSNWLYKPFNRTNDHSIEERVNIAVEDYNDIVDADSVILISSPKRVPGGKFVEAGIALGQRKPVYVIGHRENMLMWHPNIIQYDSIEDFMKDY